MTDLRRCMKNMAVLGLLVVAMFAMVPATEARLAPLGVQYDRQAVVNEANYALYGPYYGPLYNGIGMWNYLYSDMNAYWHTRNSWSVRYPYGYMSNNVNSYLTTLFYDGKIQEYGFYGGKPRGGQCKYFANLLLYRAGVISLKTDPFPTYAEMQQNSNPASSAKPADVLFQNGVHTAIVTGVVRDSTGAAISITVVDSNWVTGGGNEVIGTHTYNKDQIANYRVYAGVPYYNY